MRHRAPQTGDECIESSAEYSGDMGRCCEVISVNGIEVSTLLLRD
jgi:hypothetical protein